MDAKGLPNEEAIQAAGMLDLVMLKLSCLQVLKAGVEDDAPVKKLLERVKEELVARNYTPLFPGGEPF